MEAILPKAMKLWKKYQDVPVEAVLVVLFSQLPVLLASFFALAEASEERLERTAFLAELFSRYTANDVFIYATGVLGSAVVFFVLKLGMLANKSRIIWTGVIVPLVVIFACALIPASTSLTGAQPNSFVREYSFWMLVLLFVTWLVALIEQRNIEQRKPDLDGNQERISMEAAASEKIG
jgi:hypothetical protein